MACRSAPDTQSSVPLLVAPSWPSPLLTGGAEMGTRGRNWGPLS